MFALGEVDGIRGSNSSSARVRMDSALPAGPIFCHGAAMRVLLVEDDSRVAKSVVALLTALGHEVARADGYESAQGAISGGSYHVVLTDYELGTRETGLDVIRFCATHCPPVRVVLYSGALEHELSRRAVSAGAACCLAKPFTIDQLVMALENEHADRERHR